MDNGFQITIGGRAFLLKLERTVDPDVLVALIGDKPLNVTLEAANNQAVTMTIDGELLSFRKPVATAGSPPRPAPSSAIPKDAMAAPMPGRIIGIMTKEGERVKPGDPLVIVESMKMETVIRSDRDAEVERILVADGTTVKRGQPLVRFRP